MDTKIKVVAFGFFLVLLLVPFWVTNYLLQNGRASSDNPLSQTTSLQNQETFAERAGARDSNQAVQLIRQAKLEEAARRISSLEALLDKQEKLLATKDDLIAEKESQCTQLKHEMDQYLAALVQVMAEEPAAEPDSVPLATKEAANLQTQLDELKSKLTHATTAERTSQTEIAELDQQLLAANRKLALYEAAANLEKDQSLQLVSKRVIARSGAAAVPALMELMADPRANLRSWAATLLGEIGPDARDAAFVLREAISDSDARVRAAARIALIEILD